MQNPLDAIAGKISEIKAAVLLEVHVKLCKEAVDVNLSRLKDLDPGNASIYDETQQLVKTAK